MSMNSNWLSGLGAVAIGVILTACGGGGGSSSGTTTDTTVTTSGTGIITGAVAGTTIIAVNGQGDIVATDDTSGRNRDVDTDSDGLYDAYSFALNGVPLSENVRVYLVTGGGIYPMYFDSDADGVADSNVFEMTAGSTGRLALGFIRVDVEAGRSVPANDPVDDEAVLARGSVDAIPASINEPPTDGLTVAELNEKGKGALRSGWVLGAKNYFQAAADLAANSSGDDADTARFMLAITRVSALGYDTLSDGNSGDLNRLADLLDLFGIANDGNRANWELVEKPDMLPADSPDGNEVRDFSYEVVRPELQAAATSLDAVSEAFNLRVTRDGKVASISVSGTPDPDLNRDGDEVYLDYGDVLFIRAMIRSMQGSIEVASAYNLGMDIDQSENSNLTARQVHDSNAALLGRPDLARFAEAKSSFATALNDMKAAIESIEAETDNQADDFITLDATVDTVEMKNWIDQTLASIAGTSTRIGKVSVDLQTFFNSGVRLDDTTLPALAGNDIDPSDGFFDDPTMGGVILDPATTAPGIQSINKDTGPYDGIADGIPDILQ